LSTKCSKNSFSFRFVVLEFPDNELEELADNFFCHLHDHTNNKGCSHQEKSLIDSLNPLREDILRKSILENITFYLMNENHLNIDSLNVNNENLNITCKNCSSIIGYKSKKITLSDLE
jgi:hypothetical protein